MSIIKYLILVAICQVIKPYWVEIAIIFAVFVAWVVILHLLKLRKEKGESKDQDVDSAKLLYADVENPEPEMDGGQTLQEDTDSTEQKEMKPDTCGLMMRALSSIGCQPTKNDDGTVSVSYQGENFTITFGGMYARIWDPLWASVKADTPHVPLIREAVNLANYQFGPTVVLSKPDDEGNIGFHSRRDIMLHPACPDNELYVKAVLNSFFDKKEELRSIFNEIFDQQMEEQRSRRPVGFRTDAEAEE